MLGGGLEVTEPEEAGTGSEVMRSIKDIPEPPPDSWPEAIIGEVMFGDARSCSCNLWINRH